MKEYQIQRQLIAECNNYLLEYPQLKLIFHIPNGGKRDGREAKNLKLQGVKAGVPDLFLPIPSQEYHGLFIELKAGKNKPSDFQKEWIKDLRENGYQVAVCYSVKESIDVINKYLGIDIHYVEFGV